MNCNTTHYRANSSSVPGDPTALPAHLGWLMILMYHHIAPPEAVPPEAEPIEGWQYTLSPGEFEGQLGKLLELGYRFVPLTELVAEIKRRGSEPPRMAVITFDDGWSDNFTFAFPVLQRLGLPATFFIVTDHIRRGVEDKKRMSVSQLRQLIGAGINIGGHSRTHPNLATLPEVVAREEIAGCKQDLEKALGTAVNLFAHPFGAHNPTSIRLIREAGYVAACSAWGDATNTRSSLFWLYREILSPKLNTHTDRRALSPFYRRATALKRQVRNKAVQVLRPVVRRKRTG